MSGMEGVSVAAWGGREWKRDLPWLQSGASAEDSARISEAELLAVVEEWLGQTTSVAISETPTELVSDWFQSLQNLIGCQGLGLFQRQEQDWQALIRHGGRSLGRPATDWLTQVQSTGEPQGRLDDPAEGWGQLAFPLHCPLLCSSSTTADAGVIVFSARHPESLDIAATEELVLLLERLSLHAFEQADAFRRARRETEHARDLTTLLASRSLEDLRKAFDQAVERTASGWASRFVLIPAESTTVLATVEPTTFETVPGVNSGDVIACFHTEAANHTSTLTALLPNANAHALRNMLCLPFVDMPAMQGGCLIWPEEAAFDAAAETEQTQHDRRRYLSELVRTCGQRWQELLRTESPSQRGGIRMIPDDSLADEYCRATLPASLTLPTGAKHSLLLAGGPGSPLIAAVHHVLQAAGGQAAANLLHCRSLTTEELQAELSRYLPEAAGAGNTGDLNVASEILILHEIDQLTLTSQQLLLDMLRQAVENRRFRLICTTGRDLQLSVARGEFLDQLLTRVGTMQLHLPPLKSQPALALQLFRQALAEAGKGKTAELDDEAIHWLNDYRWPGGLDELRQAARRLQPTLNENGTISRHDLTLLFEQEALPAHEMAAGLAEATVEFQQLHIRRAIARAGGNMTEAARLLDLHRSNLYRKMNQLNMAEAGGAEED